jgi:hypothetical protein
MKLIKYFLLSISVLAMLSTSGIAGENSSKSGTTVAQFLKIGIGARAMGMAGANMAASNDVYGLYWNPSTITNVPGVSFAGVYSDWFAGIKHQFFGLVLPAGEQHTFGVQVITLNMDPIEVTTVSDPHGTGEFYDASDLAIGVTYAGRLTNYFSLGVTAKYVQQTIYNETASTYAFDMGSQLNIPYYGLKLGMNFSNFGGKMVMDGRDLIREYDMNPNNSLNDGVESKLKTEPWELPLNFAVGLSMDLIAEQQSLLDMEKNRLTFAMTGNHPADSEEFASFGLEYGYRELVFLRSGYRLNRDLEKMFYGLGVKVPLSNGAFFNMDYSLASYGELNYIHIFSTAISLK